MVGEREIKTEQVREKEWEKQTGGGRGEEKEGVV